MTTRQAFIAGLTYLSCVAFAPAVLAWEPKGVPVCGSDCVGFFPLIVPDGEGGAFVAWTDERQSPITEDDAYVQRLTADGTVSAGWPASGLPVCVLPRHQGILSIAQDGFGGVLLVWEDHRDAVAGGTGQDVYAQRINADGTIATGWPADGAPVSRGPDDQALPLIIPDQEGGAYVAWLDWRDYVTRGTNIYAQHLTPTGAVAPGWPGDGLAVCTFTSGGQVAIPDDSGGVVIAWTDVRRGMTVDDVDVYGQRLAPDGTIRPGWTENGRLLASQRARPQICSDDAGGFFLAYGKLPSNQIGQSEYYVQRLSFSGEVVPGWPAGGAVVCAAPNERDALHTTEDGLGGILLAWFDYRNPGFDIYAARFLANGSLAPGWTVDGTLVSDPGEPNEYFPLDLAADGTGGAYVVWEWNAGVAGDPSRLQHLGPTGAPVPGWPPFGVRVSPSLAQFSPQLAPDGSGGVIIAWDESHMASGRLGIYAQRFGADGPVPTLLSLAQLNATSESVILLWQGPDAALRGGTVERKTTESPWAALGSAAVDAPDRLRYEDRDVRPGARYAYRLAYTTPSGEREHTDEVWVTVPEAATFALGGFRPNPAQSLISVAFSLPTSAPAEIVVFDVAGRLQLAQEVGTLGPGRHQVQLARTRALQPGIYWIRLTQEGLSAVAKGMVSR